MNNKKWIELIEANREEIIEKGIEQYKDRYSYNGLSGWYVGVEMDDKGTVYTVGPMSRGSQTMASYNGTSMTLLWLSTENYEFEGRMKDYLDRIEDLDAFKEYLVYEHDIDKDSDDFEDELSEAMTMYEYSQFNSEKYKEFVDEDFEWYISEYAREEVINQLEDRIATQIEPYVDIDEEEELD